MNHTLSANKKKRTIHKSSADNDSVKPVFMNALKGCAIGIVSALLMLLAACAIAMSSEDPASLAGPISYVVLLSGSFVGGIASAKLNGSDTMLCGIMCGALYLGFVLIVSLFIHSTDSKSSSFILSLGLRSVSILSAIVGACISDKKAKKAKKRKRH